MTRVAGQRHMNKAKAESPPKSKRSRKQQEEQKKVEMATARSSSPIMPQGRSSAGTSAAAASGSGTGRVNRRRTSASSAAGDVAAPLPLGSRLKAGLKAAPRNLLHGLKAVSSAPQWPLQVWQRLRNAVVGGYFPDRGPVDLVLACAIIALLFFGLVMVYSASAVHAQARYGSAEYLAVKQAAFVVCGLLIMWMVSRVDYRRFRRVSGWGLLVAIGLLVITLTTAGTEAGGAARWIRLGGINVQPAELAKVAMIMWLASSLATKAERVHTFWIGYMPHVLAAGLVGGLCLMQPDFGSAVMVSVMTLIMLVAAGARFRYLIPSVVVAVPLAYAAIVYSPYRRARFEAFRAPFQHLQTGGYQLAKSQLAFGTGGLEGLGLGDSKQKLFFLPEAHTDFIAAVIGEELGLVGMGSMVALFCLIFARGLRAAFNAADEFGAYLATGISMFVALQVFVNLSVTVGLVPTKGLVLPFISYGGSAMLVNCAAMGILLSVSRSRVAVAGPQAVQVATGGVA